MKKEQRVKVIDKQSTEYGKTGTLVEENRSAYGTMDATVRLDGYDYDTIFKQKSLKYLEQ